MWLVLGCYAVAGAADTISVISRGLIVQLAASVAGADSAGPVRTEFLFLGRDRARDIDEQVDEYLAITAALRGRRVTIRTLDVGGDKPLSYLPTAVEDNPFLGNRGIRLSLDRPELLRDQLVAVCRVARQAPISVMFPMVTTVAERKLREAFSKLLRGRGLPPGLRVGMMVEVPAAALEIGAFLAYLDFSSISTNDLTQDTLAAECGNAALVAPRSVNSYGQHSPAMYR